MALPLVYLPLLWLADGSGLGSLRLLALLVAANVIACAAGHGHEPRA